MTAPKSDGRLSTKEAAFVACILTGLDGAEAARQAGYAPKAAKEMAYELRQRPRVAAAIAAGEAEAAARLAAANDRVIDSAADVAQKTAEMRAYVLDRLRDNVERSLVAVPVLDSKGLLTGVYKYEGAVANRALELLGKEAGMFRERVEHSGPDGGSLEVVVTRRIIRPEPGA